MEDGKWSNGRGTAAEAGGKAGSAFQKVGEGGLAPGLPNNEGRASQFR